MSEQIVSPKKGQRNQHSNIRKGNAMKFEIKNWMTGAIMFSIEGDSFKLALCAAVKNKQEFKYADLSEKDLSGIDLDGGRFDNSRFDNSSFDNSRFYNSSFDNSSFDNIRFYNSSFDNSSFDNSSFDNSRFDNSRFDNSRFYNSSFYNSRFYNSSFDNSRFYNSSFDNSSFDNSRFYNSRFDNKCILPESWLIICRDDLWAVLSAQPHEVEGLRQSLIDGKVNGSTYEGDCACLVGTIANVAHCGFKELPVLKPNSHRPAEVFFLSLNVGDTPEKSRYSKLAVEWIDQWLANMRAAFQRDSAKAQVL